MRRNTGLINVVTITVAFAITLILSGCGSGDLNRKKAAKLIKNTSKLQEIATNVVYQNNGKQKSEKLNMWASYSLGKKFLKNTTPDSSDNPVLLEPLDPVITITGITDSIQQPNLKEVQFVWEYKDTPEELRRVIAIGGNGNSLLRKYDDGWRVESIRVDHSKIPTLTTAEQKREQEALKIAFKERQDYLKKQRNEYRVLLEKSKIPATVKGTFKGFDRGKIGNSHLLPKVLVKDKSVYFQYKGVDYEIWFGHIDSFKGGNINFKKQYARDKNMPSRGYPSPLFVDSAEKELFAYLASDLLEKWKEQYPLESYEKLIQSISNIDK